MGNLIIGKEVFSAAGVGDGLVSQCPQIKIGPFVHEIIVRHTAQGCEFFPGAEERLLTKFDRDALAYPNRLDLYDALDAEESYCPFEGIDRRAELAA